MSDPVDSTVSEEGLVVSESMLAQAGLRPGDRVRVQVVGDGQLVVSRTSDDKAVDAAAERFMTTYDDAMQRLAQ